MGSDERWVCLARLLPPDHAAWGWQARAVWPWLLAWADENGFIPTRKGLAALAAATRFPIEIVEAGVAELAGDGLIETVDGGFSVPSQEPEPSSARVSGGSIETYVVQRGDGGPVKIGKSSRFESRLASLQTGSAEKLIVLHRIRGDHEARLHAACREWRSSGEWFKPEPMFFTTLSEHIGADSGNAAAIARIDSIAKRGAR